jgi:hypothetical protein
MGLECGLLAFLALRVTVTSLMAKGWVDVTKNGFVDIAKHVNGIPISTNGPP